MLILSLSVCTMVGAIMSLLVELKSLYKYAVLQYKPYLRFISPEPLFKFQLIQTYFISRK